MHRAFQDVRRVAGVGFLLGMILATTGCWSTSNGYFDHTKSYGDDDSYSYLTGSANLATGVPGVPQFSALSQARLAPPPPSPPPAAQLVAFDDELRETPIEQQQRMVIYSAGYTIVVRDPAAAIRDVEQIAEEFDGFVHAIKGDVITIRVPAAQFESASQRIAAMGEVTGRELQAADVTDEYTDLGIRLRNAQRVLERLQQLLAKAEDVKTTLEVERELARVTEEIERLEARLASIQQRVALSTITATFTSVARQEGPWKDAMRLPFGWLHTLEPRALWRYY